GRGGGVGGVRVPPEGAAAGGRLGVVLADEVGARRPVDDAAERLLRAAVGLPDVVHDAPHTVVEAVTLVVIVAPVVPVAPAAAGAVGAVHVRLAAARAGG